MYTYIICMLIDINAPEEIRKIQKSIESYMTEKALDHNRAGASVLTCHLYFFWVGGKLLGTGSVFCYQRLSLISCFSYLNLIKCVLPLSRSDPIILLQRLKFVSLKICMWGRTLHIFLGKKGKMYRN